MAAIATLGIDETLFTLRVEWLYTLARLLKSVHAQGFAPEFQALGPVIDAAIKTQGSLDDTSILAAAGRDAADESLDPLVIQILAAIQTITKGDRTDPFYVSYAGDQTAAQITRPVLGPELATASDWLGPLKDETDPTLKSFAAPLESAVMAGTDAEKDVKASDKALSDFRLVGERKKVVDALNAGRASLFGKLLQFQHDHPDLRLPSDWAAGFFRHSVKTAKYGTTIAQVEAYLAKLENDMTSAKAFLADLQQKAAAHAEAKAKREKARQELSETRKAAKVLKQQEKVLEAEAKKKLKK